MQSTLEVETLAGERVSFDDSRRQTNVQGLKAASIVAFILLASFAPVEYYVVPEHFPLLQGLRAACLLVLAMIAVVAFRGEAWTRRHVDVLTVGAFLIVGWYSIVLMSLHDGYESPFFLTLVFSIVGVSAVTLWPLRTALIFMALMIGSYLTPLVAGWVELTHPDTFLIQLSFLLGMAIIGVVAQQLRYRIEQREFRTNQRLGRTKATLENAYTRLKELDEQKSDFFANVSHELRTPLTLSLGPLESLLKMEHRAEEQEHLHALHRNQLRLLRLINQLLDVAKVESGNAQAEYSKEDVVLVVRELVGEIEEATRAKGIRLDVIVPSEPVCLYIDREKFEQLLLNLLSNAFKFTETGGRIEVSLMRGTESSEIAVRDTGIGIPESKLHTIFDRFTQADSSETRQYPGTGIGLALVQSYVELHGGTIGVESTVGVGTTFAVSLRHGKAHLPAEQIRSASRPVSMTSVRPPQLTDFDVDEGDEAVVERAPAGAPEPQRETTERPEEADWLPDSTESDGEEPRVLIVDDTADMRRYLLSLLREEYDVKTAKNGAEGLALAKDWDPDLVISDVMMPLMSGSELCRAIKAGGGRLSRTPVMLVTARTEEQTKLRGLDYGADDYLLKPFLQEELLLRVRNLVSKRRQERALFDAHLVLRAQHQYVQSDLELARDFQNDLLPKLEMPAPLTAHVEFHPADLVGGDFYHITPLGPGRVRLFLADMVDHGVKAAVRAAAALPEYTGLDHTALDAGGVLESLNEVATSKYADLAGSFLCLDLDASREGHVSIRYARAGEMPFVVISEAGPTEPPAAAGFMVGLFPNMSYRSRALTLSPGTRLFLYSDGLYTQTNGSGRTFRDEGGLMEAWAMTRDCSTLQAATESVMESLTRFRGTTPQLDDVTLIGIEIPGPR
ncbi:MAG: response regulator [Myxococcales bacterium]|nr:response regulator [Deltaproteobacteria bacterium]NND30134.1 response regulator [Myxococcales bacterium]NNL25123.1 response regulator [Myxococcales bacterium]